MDNWFTFLLQILSILVSLLPSFLKLIGVKF